MDSKKSIKATVFLCLGTALSILAQVILWNAQEHGRLVIIGGITGYDLITFFEFDTVLCIGGLLSVLIATKDKDGKPRRAYNAVIFVLGMIFIEIPVILYFLINLPSFAKMPSDPKKLKSPDGKHFVIRTELSSQGRHVYGYYFKERGVIYRPIFKDDDKNFEHGLEWTDEGIIYEGKLYEY